MKSWAMLCSTAVVIGICGVGCAEEGEEQDTTVTQSELPGAVTQAVKEFGKGGEFVSAVKADEDGVQVYEVTLNKDGKKIEVQTTLDGELNMREEVVDNGELPKAAADRISKAHPGSQVKRVEKTIRSVYEVQITDASGKKSEVLVTPGGQLTIEPEELGGKGGEEAEEKEEKEEKDEKSAKSEHHRREKGEKAEKGKKE